MRFVVVLESERGPVEVEKASRTALSGPKLAECSVYV